MWAELAHQWSLSLPPSENQKSAAAATTSGFGTILSLIQPGPIKWMPCPLPLSPHAAKDQVLRSQLQLLQNSQLPLQLCSLVDSRSTDSSPRHLFGFQSCICLGEARSHVESELKNSMGNAARSLVEGAWDGAERASPPRTSLRQNSKLFVPAIQFTLHRNEESHLYNLNTISRSCFVGPLFITNFLKRLMPMP